VSENAPEMRACDAMIAAIVASAISGYWSALGASRKNGLTALAGSRRISAPWPK
jgi:hypothetical protein